MQLQSLSIYTCNSSNPPPSTIKSVKCLAISEHFSNKEIGNLRHLGKQFDKDSKIKPHLQDRLQEQGLGIEGIEFAETKKKKKEKNHTHKKHQNNITFLPAISVNRIVIWKFLEVLHLSHVGRFGILVHFIDRI